MTDPHKRLIPVFAGPRSGSNYLIDLLAKVPGIVALSEVFNPSGIYGLSLHPDLQDKLIAEAGSEDALFELFRMEPERAVMLLLGGIPADSKLVLKIHPHQVHSAAMRRILTRHATGAAVLVRRRLDQFVSLEKALARQTWFKTDTTEMRPVIGAQSFLSWAALMDDWITSTQALCHDSGLPLAWFEYDADLKSGDSKNLAHTLASRLTTLGVDVPPHQINIKSGFTRQDLTDDTFNKFANGTELKTDLAGLGCLDYALDAQRPAPTPNLPETDVEPILPDDPTDVAKLLREGHFDTIRAGLLRVGQDLHAGPHRLQNLPEAEPQFTRFTFICGLHRSGTTLLHDHLAAHYDVTVLDNAKVPRSEGQFLQDVLPQEHPFGGPGLFAFAPQMAPPAEPDPLRAGVLANRMCRTWAAQTRDPLHPHLLEKSPPNLTRIAFLRSLFPAARFVVMVRDPRAVTLATKKWQPAASSDLLLAHWHTAHLTALQQLGPDCLVLRYEDFCASPSAELLRVADFCELAPRVGSSRAPKPEEICDTNQTYLSDWSTGKGGFEPVLKAWNFFGYDF